MSLSALLTAAKLRLQALEFLSEERILAACSFGLPFLIYCFTLNSGGGQAQNIVSMQSSILQYHSFNVYPFGMDMIQQGGKFYNVYAPGLAFLSFPFAMLGFVSYGILNGYVGNAILMDGLFLTICASISGYLVFKTSQLFTKSAFASLLASLALTLGTVVWPYAVSVFPHDASMLFSLLAVYLMLRYSRFQYSSSYLLGAAGLSLGIATLVEYAAGIFVIPLFLYIVWGRNLITRQHGAIEVTSFVAFFAAIGVGLNFLYNYMIFGNPFEFPQQASGSGVHFLVNNLLFEHALYYLISPFRGVFLLCPVLILGFFGMREMWKWYRRESLLFLSLFGAVMIYYSAWQGWDGAWAYGPRFLIIGLPYLALPIAFLLSQKREFIRAFL
ncbi:MAG: glycosyltransferase family 39 protein, partial [Nitrososphaerales archaeon]